MVVNGTKKHPTKSNSAEHYRMVQIVAKRYWSVSKGTKRYWTVLSVSEWNWYCTVPNDAEWYQMLPNKTQSLLLGNPTNPSMAVLGPLWLYEAGHWQIEPTTVLPLLKSDSKTENSDYFLTIFRGKCGLLSLLGQILIWMQTLSLIYNTSLAAPGALAHLLQRRTVCNTSPSALSKIAHGVPK